MATSRINRQYRFSDGVPLVNSQVDQEFNNVIGTLNSTTVLTLAAPDGKLFNISIIYDSDGVTPLLQITSV